MPAPRPHQPQVGKIVAVDLARVIPLPGQSQVGSFKATAIVGDLDAKARQVELQGGKLLQGRAVRYAGGVAVPASRQHP